MKAQAKVVKTPVGDIPWPMNPAFSKTLENCKNDEDLFNLVEENGFINPDAFTEVLARGLSCKYKGWKKQKGREQSRI